MPPISRIHIKALFVVAQYLRQATSRCYVSTAILARAEEILMHGNVLQYGLFFLGGGGRNRSLKNHNKNPIQFAVCWGQVIARTHARARVFVCVYVCWSCNLLTSVRCIVMSTTTTKPTPTPITRRSWSSQIRDREHFHHPPACHSHLTPFKYINVKTRLWYWRHIGTSDLSVICRGIRNSGCTKSGAKIP